jgi:hypothetical protein
MEEGFIPDVLGALHAAKPSEWYEGELTKSLWFGVKTLGKSESWSMILRVRSLQHRAAQKRENRFTMRSKIALAFTIAGCLFAAEKYKCLLAG